MHSDLGSSYNIFVGKWAWVKALNDFGWLGEALLAVNGNGYTAIKSPAKPGDSGSMATLGKSVLQYALANRWEATKLGRVEYDRGAGAVMHSAIEVGSLPSVDVLTSVANGAYTGGMPDKFDFTYKATKAVCEYNSVYKTSMLETNVAVYDMLDTDTICVPYMIGKMCKSVRDSRASEYYMDRARVSLGKDGSVECKVMAVIDGVPHIKCKVGDFVKDYMPTQHIVAAGSNLDSAIDITNMTAFGMVRPIRVESGGLELLIDNSYIYCGNAGGTDVNEYKILGVFSPCGLDIDRTMAEGEFKGVWEKVKPLVGYFRSLGTHIAPAFSMGWHDWGKGT